MSIWSRVKLSGVVALLSLLALSACVAATEPEQSTSTSLAPTTSSSSTTTTLPATTTTEAPAEFLTVEGTPPHALGSFESVISVTMTLPGAEIAVDGTGVYTSDAFTCDLTLGLGGFTVTQRVFGTPESVWIDDGFGFQEVAPFSPEATSATSLCPASPLFWAGFGPMPPAATFEAEIEDFNGVPSKKLDMTALLDSLSGFGFSELEGVSFEQAVAWIADPGDWVSGIEMTMNVEPEAATLMWGLPADPDAGPTQMAFQVAVFNPDDPTLTVDPPEEAGG